MGDPFLKYVPDYSVIMCVLNLNRGGSFGIVIIMNIFFLLPNSLQGLWNSWRIEFLDI